MKPKLVKKLTLSDGRTFMTTRALYREVKCLAKPITGEKKWAAMSNLAIATIYGQAKQITQGDLK